jgi:hypothetical protein
VGRPGVYVKNFPPSAAGWKLALSGLAIVATLVLPGLIAGIIVALAGSFGLAISGVGAVATGTIEQPLN